jgi:hypothetical protein
MYQISEEQARFIAGLLVTPEVCALLRTPQTKELAASLQVLSPVSVNGKVEEVESVQT